MLASGAPVVAGEGSGGATAPAERSSRIASPADTLVVLFTGETRGNLTPCSCPEEPLGGLARRVAFLADRGDSLLRAGVPVLRLDSGGFLPAGEVSVRNDPRLAERWVALLLDGMEAAGIEASVLDPGMRDFLEQIAPGRLSGSPTTYLATTPPSSPWHRSWRGGAVAVIALDEFSPDSILVEAGRRARQKAETVIVLARADAVSGRRVARLSGADLVLLSRGTRLEEPLREGGTWLLGPGKEGKWVGEARLVRRQPSAGDPSELVVTGLRLHAMGPGAPEDERLAEEVARLMTDGRPWSTLLSERDR